MRRSLSLSLSQHSRFPPTIKIHPCGRDSVVVSACVAVQYSYDKNNHHSPNTVVLRILQELRQDPYVAVSTHGTEDFGAGRPCEGMADCVCPPVAAVTVSKPIELSFIPSSSKLRISQFEPRRTKKLYPSPPYIRRVTQCCWIRSLDRACVIETPIRRFGIPPRVRRVSVVRTWGIIQCGEDNQVTIRRSLAVTVWPSCFPILVNI